MLNMISKILILGIIMCLASLSHAITGNLDEKAEYHVVEGDDLNITCTVNDGNNESIWWLVRYLNSPWYQSATSNNMSLHNQPSFFESFELGMDSENEFIFRMINISRVSGPTIICGYVRNQTKPFESTDFAAFSNAVKIRIWVEPKCMQNGLIPEIIPSDQSNSTTLTCTTEGYSNPSPSGLQWYENGMLIGSPEHVDETTIQTTVSISADDRGTQYVCKVNSTTVNLTCEIIPYDPTLPPTTELTTELAITETTFVIQTTELASNETTNQTNSTVGFWTDMMIIVFAAPGGTLVLILIIIIVACLCSCIKKNKTDKNIEDAETASDTNTKSAIKTNDTATSNGGVNETNGGMKMNNTNEKKPDKIEKRKDDAIPVYDDVANGDNAEKTDKPNGELNNGKDKEAENMDKNGEEIPLYDNMRDDRVEKPDMSKANVEGLEYADIAIGSTMDGPPNSEDIIRKESATVYADLMV